MSKEVKLLDQNVLAKSENIDSLVAAFHEQNFSGFQLSLATAKYLGELKNLIDDNYMKEILPLQGYKLGFKTDKDKDGGYDKNTVKDVLIEAVLTGLQPVGNHFNIIGGNFYITREGAEYMLSKAKGLRYDIIYDLPEIRNEKSASVKCVIKWSLNGESNEQEITFPIKSNKYLSDDGIIGKAKRKASVWLVNKLKGTNLADSDLDDRDRDVTAPKSKLEITLEKEGRKIEVEEAEALDQSVLDTIEGFTTQEEVKAFYDSLSADDKKTYKAIITKKGVSLMTKK
jgi:hypothetical protein